MSKHQIAFWLIVAGLAVHVLGNGKKAIDQVNAGATPTNNDYLYYGATIALAVGIGINWKSLK